MNENQVAALAPDTRDELTKEKYSAVRIYYGQGECRAGSDGDCAWVKCPQLRDNEPATTGRHCPMDEVPNGA